MVYCKQQIGGQEVSLTLYRMCVHVLIHYLFSLFDSFVSLGFHIVMVGHFELKILLLCNQFFV